MWLEGNEDELIGDINLEEELLAKAKFCQFMAKGYIKDADTYLKLANSFSTEKRQMVLQSGITLIKPLSR